MKAGRAHVAVLAVAIAAAVLLYPDSEPSGDRPSGPAPGTSATMSRAGIHDAAALAPQAVPAQADVPARAASAPLAAITETVEHASGDDPSLRYEFREEEGVLRRVVHVPGGAAFASPFGAQGWTIR